MEKMEKKNVLKVILIAFVALVIVVVLVCLLRRNTIYTPDKINSKPINDKVNLELVFDELEKISGLETYESTQAPENIDNPEASGEVQIEAPETNDRQQIPPEEAIDFRAYKVLEKKAIVNTTDEYVNEVWMIKLGDYHQQEDIARLLGTRIDKLRNAFQGNETQLNIINQAKIKQEGAIVIMIISPEARIIEETIANAMK